VSPDLPESNPRIGQQSFDAQPLPSDRCGSEGRAMHVTAKNIGMCFGSNGRIGWGGGLDITFVPPLDAAMGGWDGISFWVKRGSPSSKSALILSVVDAYSYGAAADPETGVACNASDPVPGIVVLDTEKCDAFGTAISLTDEWTFYPARFDDMRQKGFGLPSPLGRIETSEIVRLQFLLSAGDWDFWVDDVQLFRDPE